MGTPPFPDIAPDEVAAEFEHTLVPGERVGSVRFLPKAYGHLGFLIGTRNGKQWVLKIGRIPAEVVRFARTHEATELAREAGVSTPRVWKTGQSERFGGLPFLVQEFLPGTDGEDAWGTLNERQCERYLYDFGVAVARLHQVKGRVFTENAVLPEKAASWAAHVEARLQHLLKLNSRWATMPTQELTAYMKKLAALANEVAPAIVPTLTHRDLYLRNTLAWQGQFTAILDFEHARFSDPVMEFVKLEALLFEVYPDSRRIFEAGYRTLNPNTWPLFADRFRLCRALELLGALPFHARNDEHLAREAALRRLRATL